MKQVLQFKRQITQLLDEFRYLNMCLVNNFLKKESKKSLQNLYTLLTKVGEKMMSVSRAGLQAYLLLLYYADNYIL